MWRILWTFALAGAVQAQAPYVELPGSPGEGLAASNGVVVIGTKVYDHVETGSGGTWQFVLDLPRPSGTVVDYGRYVGASARRIVVTHRRGRGVFDRIDGKWMIIELTNSGIEDCVVYDVYVHEYDYVYNSYCSDGDYEEFTSSFRNQNGHVAHFLDYWATDLDSGAAAMLRQDDEWNQLFVRQGESWVANRRIGSFFDGEHARLWRDYIVMHQNIDTRSGYLYFVSEYPPDGAPTGDIPARGDIPQGQGRQVSSSGPKVVAVTDLTAAGLWLYKLARDSSGWAVPSKSILPWGASRRPSTRRSSPA